MYEIYKENPHLPYVMLQWNQGIYLDILNLAIVKAPCKQVDRKNTPNYSTYLSYQSLQKC